MIRAIEVARTAWRTPSRAVTERCEAGGTIREVYGHLLEIASGALRHGEITLPLMDGGCDPALWFERDPP
jgi:hypothetical protein